MFDTVDDSLTKWIREILGDVELSLGPPKGDFDGLHVYLLELLDRPPAHENERTSMVIALRYLICAGDREPRRAHQRLGELFFAAKQHTEFEAHLERLPAGLWSAFGVAPRPAFQLDVPARHTVTREVRRVEHELVLRSASLGVLHGHVLGHDKPLANALVELPSLGRRMKTGFDGMFRFAKVPIDRDPVRMVVRARGQEHEFRIEKVLPDTPLIVRFFEGEVVHV
jgi:hypothetical protein